METSLRNGRETALITGASSGIGLELAKQCARHGYDVLLVSSSQAELEEAAAHVRAVGAADVHVCAADLSTREGAKRLYADVQYQGLTVDVLVNNAGVGVYGRFTETSLADELAMIELNVASVVQLTKLFANDMLQRGSGKILFTSSIAGLGGSPWLSVYGATKAFDMIFALGLREELKDSGITVTVLLPAETNTGFFQRAGMENSKILQGNLTDPAKVAKEGFEALMNGDATVGGDFKAKMMNVFSGILPETTKAKISRHQQEPVNA